MAKRTEEELTEYQRQLDAEKSRLLNERDFIQQQLFQLARESQELARLKSQNQGAAQGINAQEQKTTNMVENTMGTIGHMKEFALSEDFGVWFEQFEEYVTVNKIPVERSVSLFLTLMGTDGYKLLRNLCVPLKPRDKSLDELMILIKKHHNPKPNMIAERFKFKKRRQRQDESISMFLASLKQMSVYCDFGETLNNNLRDQLVWSLRNGRIQRKLLSETQLTLDRTVELSLAWEVAEKDAGN